MSYAAENWARAQIAGNARAKAVLIELAHCHNRETGRCDPSIRYLSTVTELMPDTVSKATNELVARGLIVKTVVTTRHGRRCSYTLNFSPVEWEARGDVAVKLIENGDNPEYGDTPKFEGTPETTGTGTLETMGTGTPKSEGTGTPENGDITGNKNKNRTERRTSSTPVAQGELFTNPGKKTEVVGVTTEKSARGTRFNLVELPKDWKEFAEKEEPDLDPQRLFDNFRDYWTGVSGAKAIKKDWKGTWRNFVRSFHNAEDWKRRPMLKRAPAPSTSKNGRFVEKKQSERDYSLDW